MRLKTIRKLLVIVLAMALAFALSACGKKPAESKTLN